MIQHVIAGFVKFIMPELLLPMDADHVWCMANPALLLKATENLSNRATSRVGQFGIMSLQIVLMQNAHRRHVLSEGGKGQAVVNTKQHLSISLYLCYVMCLSDLYNLLFCFALPCSQVHLSL